MCCLSLEGVVYVVADEGTAVILLPLDIITLEDRLNSGLAWALLDRRLSQFFVEFLKFGSLQEETYSETFQTKFICTE